MGIFFTHCTKSNEEDSDFNVTFVYSNGDYPSVNSKVNAKLYAYPPYTADTPAALVHQRLLTVDQLPFVFHVSHDSVDVAAYESRFSEAIANARYYVALDPWDSDNNGTAQCSGDLAIDYNREFPRVYPGIAKTINLKRLTDISCAD